MLKSYSSTILETILTEYSIKNNVSFKDRSFLRDFLYSVFKFKDFFLVDKKLVKTIRNKIKEGSLGKEDDLKILMSILGEGYEKELEDIPSKSFVGVLIHKNNEGLFNELRAMGYQDISYYPTNEIIYTSEYPLRGEWLRSFTTHPEEIFNPEGFKDWIDCGENEELFLALAALNLESNDYKWTITKIQNVEYWNEPVYPPGLKYLNPSLKFATTRPATKEEIIKHFSK